MASTLTERGAPDEPRGVSFVIPCFNEHPDVLLAAVDRVMKSGAEAGWEHEVIVVDDGSSKFSYEGSALGGARLVRHKVNRGYGASLATGIRSARFPWIGIIDADGTYPAGRFPEMLALTTDYQMIVGARNWDDIAFLRRIPKRILTWLAGYLANHSIPDLNSGMRIFHRDLYDSYRRIYPDRFSFSSTLTMVGLTGRYEVKFLPIDYFKRQGSSTIHPIKDPIRFGYQLLRLTLYFRPLRIFLPLSGLIGILACARGYRDYMLNDHFGGLTLVLCFMSFQVFFFGLIAEIINKK